MRLFVSYRRQDTEGYVGALSVLVEQRPDLSAIELFVDADKIPVGVNFVTAMLEAVRSCDAVLACIGPEWRGAAPGSPKPRLFADDDPVRMELRMAIENRLPLFVALLNGAGKPTARELPADLANLANAPTQIVSDAGFDGDVASLLARIRTSVRVPARGGPAQSTLAVAVPPGVYWASVELLVDGKSAGKFRPKTGVVSNFVVTPGPHQVQIKYDLWKSKPLAVTAREGQTVTVRYTPGLLAWQMTLELVE